MIIKCSCCYISYGCKQQIEYDRHITPYCPFKNMQVDKESICINGKKIERKIK